MIYSIYMGSNYIGSKEKNKVELVYMTKKYEDALKYIEKSMANKYLLSNEHIIFEYEIICEIENDNEIKEYNDFKNKINTFSLELE